jgi:type VI secretion system protein VasD
MIGALRIPAAMPLTFVGVLAACGGSPPPPPPPTVVEIAFRATPDVNPEPSGRPSPIILRYYQLANAGTFEKADFFQIYDREAALLGQDLLDRQELALAPGAEQRIAFEAKPGAKLIGFIAAYRDVDHAQWHADVVIPANQKTQLKVQLERLRLSVMSEASQ